MMKLQFKWMMAVLLGACLLVLTSCSDDDGNDDPNPDSVAAVRLETDETLGEILVDTNGNTLYFFTLDVDGSSNCTGGCLDAWPIFFTESTDFGEGLEADDFGTIVNASGSSQTTYKGWPLYYFAPDGNELEAVGATSGEGVNNVWFVAKPDYSIMLADAQLVGADGKNYTSEYEEGEGSTQYFVDAAGRTLYGFIFDYANTNNYTAADFSNNDVWPIFHAELAALPSTLSTDDFAVIEVFGEQQLTYKGWPLYYFDQDTERGQNKGVSVPSPGVWPIINASIDPAEDAPDEVVDEVALMENDEYGTILTDGEGRALYFFTFDADGVNHCVGGCEIAWPVFYAENVVFDAESGLDAADFDVITLVGGVKQSTYKGWPLYYYAPEGTQEPSGEVNGDGVGDVWYVAKTDYSLMIADAQLVGDDDKNYTSDYEEGIGVTTYFTDFSGRTVYVFVNDQKDTNNYTDADFTNNGAWPIFYVELDKLPSGMDKSEFGEIEVFGEKQLTFRGWPLYYFGGDVERGETKGVSVPSPGVWPIINNDLVEAE